MVKAMPIRQRPYPSPTQDQIRRVADFCQESRSVKRLFEWLGEQPPYEKGSYITVSAAMKPAWEDRKGTIEIFKRLEKIDVGFWMVGRHSNPTRLFWKCQSNELAKKVLEEIEQREMASESGDAAVTEEVLPMTIDHSFQLRPDNMLQIRLPRDVTDKEAERLAAWVRTLPF
jgi:hypothetical protein